MGNNAQTDEINFEPFFNFIILFFKTVFGFFNNFYYTVKKNFIKMMIGSFVGIVLFVSLTFIMKPRYGVEMVVSSSFLSTRFFEAEIEILQDLIDEDNVQLLSERLQISEEIILQIHSINVEQYSTRLLYNDSINRTKNFAIQIDIYNTENAKIIQNSILNYLESIPYGIKIKEQRKQNYITLITKSEKELITLDSLISILGKTMIPTANSNGFIYGEPINPISFLERGQIVMGQLLAYENALELIDNIQLVREVTPFEKAKFPKKSYFAIIGLLLGFIIVSSRTWEKK